MRFSYSIVVHTLATFSRIVNSPAEITHTINILRCRLSITKTVPYKRLPMLLQCIICGWCVGVCQAQKINYHELATIRYYSSCMQCSCGRRVQPTITSKAALCVASCGVSKPITSNKSNIAANSNTMLTTKEPTTAANTFLSFEEMELINLPVLSHPEGIAQMHASPPNE